MTKLFATKKIADCLHGRNNNFDFIRFVAALLVIFSHSYKLTPSTKDPLEAITNNNYEIGSTCVAIFFIISGFLITRSFERSRGLTEYVTSRVLRIYPLLIVVVFTTVFVVGPLLTTRSLYDYFTDYNTFKYCYSNTFMANVEYWLPGVFETNYAAKMANGSLWTLSYELFGYSLVAVIGCFAIKKKKMGILLTVFTLLVYRNRILHGKEENIRTILFFLFGALLYIYRNKIVLNSIAALIAACLLFINMRYNPVYVLSMIITGITLSYVTIYVCFIKTKYLKHFAKYGDFSYGLYIWGYLVQQIIASQYPNLDTFTFFLFSAGITFILAVLSWHLIEKRALRIKENIKYQHAIARRAVQVKQGILRVVPAVIIKRL